MAKRKKKDHRTANISRRQGVREVKQSFLIVCEGENTVDKLREQYDIEWVGSSKNGYWKIVPKKD